ncbi:hypothetical protein Tco_1564234 [Tanacetum coccineum]
MYCEVAPQLLYSAAYRSLRVLHEPCRIDAFCKQDHEDNHDDDSRPKGESSAKGKEHLRKIPEKLALVFLRSERDPKAPPRYMYNKDLFNLKNGNSETRKYVLSLHKVHAFLFPENDLEELNTRWLKKRADLDEVYSDQRIVEIIKIQYDQGHGQEFMKEIVGKRVDEAVSFGIRVHDYQLGLESYQLKVNLTAPKLIFSVIEEKTPYTITTLPFVGLIYKNINKEKRIMDIDEIPKFCDATLKRVLKDVKRTNLDVEHGYENPPLSDEDADLMVFYKEYIQDRLRHWDQMRRWERYVNGRPLQQRWEHLE